MAWALGISDGTTTVNLYSSNKATAGYYINEYPAGVGEDTSPNGTVTESAYVIVVGASIADAALKINTIQILALQARRWQATQSGPRVFIEWQPDGYAASRRSEIVDITYQVRSNTYQPNKWGGFVRHLDVTITRRNWWEQPNTAATIVSPNADYKVYNNGDGLGTSPTKNANYFDIDATAITADLPCPLSIIYTQSGFAGSGTEWFTITKAISAARLENGTREINWAEDLGASYTDNVDANRTASDYQSLTMTSGSQTIDSNTTIQAYFDRFADVGQYRMFATLAAGTPGSYRIRAFIKDNFTSYYGPYQYITLSTTFTLFDLGLIQFPLKSSPGRLFVSVGFGLQIEANGVNIRVDWFHLARTDQYRKYLPYDGVKANIFDEGGSVGAVYYLDTSKRNSDIPTIGTPLTLTPGKWNRFYFHAYSGVTAPKGIYIIPSVTYNARFLCL